MADYYTHFSCTLELPEPGHVARALAHLETFDAELREREDRSIGFAVSALPADTPTRLWFHDDASGDVEDLTAFVAELGPLLGLTGSWGFEWAHTCSKHRLDAFGGGACLVDLAKGEVIGSVASNEWLSRVLANPETAGEA